MSSWRDKFKWKPKERVSDTPKSDAAHYDRETKTLTVESGDNFLEQLQAGIGLHIFALFSEDPEKGPILKAHYPDSDPMSRERFLGHYFAFLESRGLKAPTTESEQLLLRDPITPEVMEVLNTSLKDSEDES